MLDIIIITDDSISFERFTPTRFRRYTFRDFVALCAFGTQGLLLYAHGLLATASAAVSSRDYRSLFTSI